MGGPVAIADAVVVAAQAAAQCDVAGQSGVVTSFVTATDTYTFTADDGTQVTVVYDATNDTYTIDGNPASQGAFEAAISVGDEINFVDDATAGAADADQHNLVNRTAASYTDGTIGNIDTTADTLAII